MKKLYKSKYLADENISPAQYLTEVICERIAKKERIPLGPKFWQKDEWRKIFIRQIVAANKLLIKYKVTEIIQALNHPRGRWISSLGAKKQIEQILNTYFKLSGIAPHPDLEDVTVWVDESAEKNIEEIANIPYKSLWRRLGDQKRDD